MENCSFSHVHGLLLSIVHLFFSILEKGTTIWTVWYWGCILVYVYFSERSFVHNTFQALLFSFTVWKVDRWNIFLYWRKLSLSFHGSVFETIYFLEVIKKIFNYLLIISNLIINYFIIIYFVLNFYFYFVFDTCNEIFNISCKKCKISSIKINQ
jgi:hypothetical protein